MCTKTEGVLLMRFRNYPWCLSRLRDNVWLKRPDLWRSSDWFFYTITLQAHITVPVRKFLAKNSMTLLLHPFYSLDLAPCNFFFVSLDEKRLEKKMVFDIQEVKRKSNDALKGIRI